MGGDFGVGLGARAIVGEVRTNPAVAEGNLRLKDVVAGDRRTGTPTLGDIAALTRRTDLLGVASDATELEVHLTTLDRKARLQGGEKRTTLFSRSTTEGAQLRIAAEEQATKRGGDGKEDAREDEVKVIHGRGGLGLATFIGRG
jgi:hypothetical protein